MGCPFGSTFYKGRYYSNKPNLKPEFFKGLENFLRKERLELSRVTPLEPKSSASTSSATFALGKTKHAIFTVVCSHNQVDLKSLSSFLSIASL